MYLSKDLLRVLKEKGAYVIFNTHIHDLAKQIPEMNGWTGQGNIISLVMERKDEKNTFILKRAEPDSSSYARDIAEKYGITYEQMKEDGMDITDDYIREVVSSAPLHDVGKIKVSDVILNKPGKLTGQFTHD